MDKRDNGYEAVRGAESHNGDLVDMPINGGHGDQDVDGHELNAFIEDALKGRE
jgi:hypothetical protein